MGYKNTKKETEEDWREIQDYPNYLVSNLGRIKSKGWAEEIKRLDGVRYVRRRKPKILKQYKINSGYYFVCLYNDSKVSKQFLVHRLVARSFCEGYRGGLVVNHKDGIKTNNSSNNLEWVTRSRNMKHAVSTGLLEPKVGNLLRHVNKSKREVIQYSKEGKFIDEYSSIKEAEKATGATNQAIGKACMGKYHTAGGFIWKYKNYSKSR